MYLLKDYMQNGVIHFFCVIQQTLLCTPHKFTIEFVERMSEPFVSNHLHRVETICLSLVVIEYARSIITGKTRHFYPITTWINWELARLGNSHFFGE